MCRKAISLLIPNVKEIMRLRGREGWKTLRVRKMPCYLNNPRSEQHNTLMTKNRSAKSRTAGPSLSALSHLECLG